MEVLDIVLLVAYLLGMIAFSIYLGKGQNNKDEYYVGGRNLPWWAVGISTMATQTSAISFISIPAFVALVKGGGLTWLQYELAVPLSMIACMAILIPFFRSLNLVSVYEYLEMRYNKRVRVTICLVFLVSRSFGTGVGVYASSVVLSTLLGTSIEVTILIIGVVTIIYDTIGGMKAVVYSDVIQMAVLMTGVGLAIGYSLSDVGSLSRAVVLVGQYRLSALDWAHAGFDDKESVAPLWPFLFGGFILYVSYYGTDQSQVQREMASKTLKDARRSLIFNGLVRFPLTCLYCLLGLSIGGFYYESDALKAAVPVSTPDYLVPQFIKLMIPVGAKGIIFASLLSAAMSSLDSALNSLSAATVRDFIEPWLHRRRAQDGIVLLPIGQEGDGDNRPVDDTPHSVEKKLLWLGKLTTVVWGVVVSGAAFVAGKVSSTAIQSINLIGSCFYGPVLGAFLLGILTKPVHSHPTGVIIGVICGVLCNVLLWVLTNVHWMWWNVSGVLVTCIFALICTRIIPHKHVWTSDAMTEAASFSRVGHWKLAEDDSGIHAYVGLGIYFLGMVAVMLVFGALAVYG